MRKSLNLVMAPVVERSKLNHPMVLPFGETAQQVFEKEKMLIVRGNLYWSLGFISCHANVKFIPLPDLMGVGGFSYHNPSVFSIESTPINVVELIVEYQKVAQDES